MENNACCFKSCFPLIYFLSLNYCFLLVSSLLLLT
jgi:hypothetical protein